MQPRRRYPIGAEALAGDLAHFRVWAPRGQAVRIVFEGDRPASPGPVVLEAEGNGYFSGSGAAPPGALYRVQLDGAITCPDPASRFQPLGPHGPSQIIDPRQFRWSDAGWPGVAEQANVIYELHIGAFTPEGTWAAAIEQLPHLAALGVTVLEVMPVADFPGRFGWGYDGVALFAPTRLYGTPDDFRSFIDRAHALGLAVILDVVYNHVGPDGNYLNHFSTDYFTKRYQNEWGEAINFDGVESGPVREFFIANAGYWIDEFHLDGLRLDATQQIFDASVPHILGEITAAVRRAAGSRRTLVVAENEPQDVRLVRKIDQGGYGIDALWNDDFHHSAAVALGGRNEAYFSDYLGEPQEFVSAAKWGFLYQGQHYYWQKKGRGTPCLDLDPGCFVTFLQNHDQVANTGRGRRCHQTTSPGRLRALTTLLLLGPGTPMLFQGQEFASSSPFLYFADHKPELAGQVAQGRREFLAQFPSLATPAARAALLDPNDPAALARCRLNFAEREAHADILMLHTDLIRLRRSDPVWSRPCRRGVDGAVLGAAAFVLRFFAPTADSGDRLLLVNLGRDVKQVPAPEPLLAAPAGCRWQVVFSSDDTRYGGAGIISLGGDAEWQLPGEAAIALLACPQ